ncbi:hypothetical protein [Bradyrhizobium shewense]|uniref:hypothetical protein n=1 Tax=Bradyrhizobium shewense TaxID=1761772 RepID=UPI00101AD3AE|nr:hypothetical protein [Bradyrhizobium shewense]
MLGDVVVAEVVAARTEADGLSDERGRRTAGRPSDHPSLDKRGRPAYDLANEDPELASALSPFTGDRVNRFLHISSRAAALVVQNKIQRHLGQLTGTCFDLSSKVEGKVRHQASTSLLNASFRSSQACIAMTMMREMQLAAPCELAGAKLNDSAVLKSCIPGTRNRSTPKTNVFTPSLA